MTSFATELEAVMESRRVYIRGKINYGISEKFQRFADATVSKRDKDLFVVLHDYDRGATFGHWKYPDDWYTHWNTAYGRPSLDDLRERKEAVLKRKQEQIYERSKAQWRAKEFFNKFYVSRDATRHPYVIKKRFYPYLSRQVRSWLLVPIRDIDYDLMTVQIIKPDGFKRLWKKTSQKGNMIWICDPLPENYDGVIRICEGYATGCTIHQVTQSPVICAISAGNLLDTAVLVRQKFIDAIIKICADNDQYGESNTGIIHGRAAALVTGSALHYPVFDNISQRDKPTDYNDLFALCGAKEVKRQLITIRE